MPSGMKWLGNSVAYATVLESLVQAAYTVDELVVLSGMAKMTVWKFVQALRRRKLVHISVWRTDKFGRHTKPAFSFGMVPDVARPAPKTPTRRSRDRRQRNALSAMTRSYDAVSGVAPCSAAESKNDEEELHVPSA